MQLAVRTVRESLLFWVAAGLLIFNLLDGLLTLTAIHIGAAAEANPLMDVSLAWGSLWFIAIKLSLVSLGVLLLWRLRRLPLAAFGLVGLCIFYGGIVAYQLGALGLVASQAV
jgi:hypothetical protein